MPDAYLVLSYLIATVSKSRYVLASKLWVSTLISVICLFLDPISISQLKTIKETKIQYSMPISTFNSLLKWHDSRIRHRPIDRFLQCNFALFRCNKESYNYKIIICVVQMTQHLIIVWFLFHVFFSVVRHSAYSNPYSWSIWLFGISKIRCLSRGCSAPPRSHSEPPHGFLLQCKHPMPYSNTQEDNFHFYIDFSYSHEIHYHMSVWIVLVYHSRDHECHKIPENIKSKT